MLLAMCCVLIFLVDAFFQADADGATDIKDLEALFRKINEIKRDCRQNGNRSSNSSRNNNNNNANFGNGNSGNHESRDYSVGVAVGSRAHMRKKDSEAKRSLLRNILTQGFHVLVALLCTRNVQDTQCGFKLFTRQSARVLFSNLHLESWAFDTEIIYLAEAMHIPIAEVSFPLLCC